LVDGVVALVGAGFEEREVLYEWPYDKFELFVRAVARRRLKERVDFSHDVALAIAHVLGGKDKPLEKFRESTEKHIEEEL
jgi:hypothetical protein